MQEEIEELDTEIVEDEEQEVQEEPSKASLKKLNALHGVYADYLIDQLESGEVLSSGTLAAIGSFLKNNNIQVDVSETRPTVNLTSRITALLKESMHMDDDD